MCSTKLFTALFCCIYCSVSADQPCTAESLEEQKLVNIRTLDPSIKVDLKYSTTDNFLHEDVYGDLKDCYLYSVPAHRLVLAQQYLSQIRPGYSLMVYDGARPRRVQRKMWDVVKGTSLEVYVANPESGSIHNFGAAVDLTIVDTEGKPLDMGTPFDYFGELAQPCLEEKFLLSGELKPLQLENRKLLRSVMEKAGFKGITEEWWHFESRSPVSIKKLYRIIE